MKSLIVIALIVLFAPFANADRWCEWSGTEGENCRNDRNGVLMSPTNFPTSTVSKINSWGVYHLTTTQPTIGENQIRDAEVWSKVDNEIFLTWTVRDMTETEVDQRIANPMSVTDYYIWRVLIKTGVITQQQAVDNLPADLIDAYLARKRLLGD